MSPSPLTPRAPGRRIRGGALIGASALAFLAACTSRTPEPADALASAAFALSSAETLLDLAPDGRSALVGLPHPVPPDADPMRLLDVSWRTARGATPLTLGPVRDARFIAADRAVFVDEASRLLVAALPSGEPVVLDAPVEAGLDFAPACGCVVYMRGESPFAEPAIVTLASGESRAFAEEFAPAWLPTLAPDGRSVLLVSARTGVPAFWRLPLDGGPARQLTNVGAADPLRLTPFPEGPARPVHAGTLVLFESQGRVHALGLDDGVVRWSRPALGTPRVVSGRVRFDGSPRTFSPDALLRGPP